MITSSIRFNKSIAFAADGCNMGLRGGNCCCDEDPGTMNGVDGECRKGSDVTGFTGNDNCGADAVFWL